MKNEMTVTFNNETYIATYNPQTGYYEVNLTAPDTGRNLYSRYNIYRFV